MIKKKKNKSGPSSEPERNIDKNGDDVGIRERQWNLAHFPRLMIVDSTRELKTLSHVAILRRGNSRLLAASLSN